jgi:hypothetical protein
VLAIGAEYRTSADISAMMEVRVSPRVSLGYAFDKSTTSLRTYNSGSHEFMLRYEFSFDRTEYYHPDIFNKEDLRYAIKETINDHLLISSAVHCCAICRCTTG